jgi:putative salt-induced outer membrane protein YdiY
MIRQICSPRFSLTLTIVMMFAVPWSGRAQVASPPASVPPPPKWERSASFGFTLTSGNSDTVLFTGDAQAQKKWAHDELSFGANAGYGESEDVKNNDYVKGYGQYNRLFTERFYGYARVDGLHDDIADVDYRFSIGPGAGYYFIKREQTRLSTELGPGFVIEKQGGDARSYLTLRLAERFEHKVKNGARIWQSAEILPEVEDFDNYLVNAELGVEAPLTRTLALRAVLQDTYDHEPAPGREKNDLKLITSLAWKF